MNQTLPEPPAPEIQPDTREAERHKQIEVFTRTNPDYYIAQFGRIGRSSKFTPTFNAFAGLFGPIWFGARGLWKWAVAFLIVETIAFVNIALGLFGDLAAAARDRIASVEGTLALRKQQLASAIENNTDKVDVYKRTVQSLEDAIGGIRLEAQQLEDQGIWIALAGFVILLIAKAIQSVVANTMLEARFSDWLSDRSIPFGMPVRHMV
ncbi:MAG: DUF2628 domain-containing protein, partial [Hyphomicrobiaceae bacterium]